MRIAQVAPLFESVPPRGYGGTERFVSHLTEALVQLGHDVTLFASADSRTTARLLPTCGQALRTDPLCVDAIPHQVLQLDEVVRRSGAFDLIHFNTEYLHLPLVRQLAVPSLTTFHGRLDRSEITALIQRFAHLPAVSISRSQRGPLPQLNWQATIHHGLPLKLFRFQEQPSDSLAFVGRVSPEKGVDRAIRIARAFGLPLRMAAKIDSADRAFFDRQIAPLLKDGDIEFVGEIGDHEKGALLGNARALLFPIDWPEPFGLVMIEALACGTPVIAFRHGAVPEVIEDGVTGFVVDSEEEAVRACHRLDQLDRRACRAAFEERFSAERMAREYVAVYERLVSRFLSGPRPAFDEVRA